MTIAEQQMMSRESTSSSTVILAGGRSASLSKPEQVSTHSLNSYTASYSCILRAKDKEVALAMRNIAGQICANDNFLFFCDYVDSEKRTTGYKAIVAANWEISKVSKTVYLDCSSFIATCAIGAGINVGLFGTSTERESLVGTGQFSQINKSITNSQLSGLQVGDVLWRDGHTELVYSIDGETSNGTGSGSTDSSGTSSYSGGALPESTADNSWLGSLNLNIGSSSKDDVEGGATSANYKIETKTYNVTYKQVSLKHATEDTDLQNTSLLSYPNLVESPFIQFKVGNYTFGTYKKDGNNVQYPNYIQSLTVQKINGQVNQYTIQLIHAIEPGADPNIIDKILSSAGYGALVYITYGDYCEPSYTYKEEEAILLKSTSQLNFTGSQITYTISCTSNATVLYARLFDFAARTAKPSDIIKEMMWHSNDKYGLLNIFRGMTNEGDAASFIAGDDVVVDIPAKKSMNPLAYLNFLVTFMAPTTGSTALQTATYKMCLYDATSQVGSKDMGGAYFKVVKLTLNSNLKALSTGMIYEIDVGYPTDSIINFTASEDESWSLLYKYADEIKEPVYNISNNGTVTAEYLPKAAVSTSQNKSTQAQKNWWKEMTSFPISAQLTLRGLVVPILLMDYLRINVLFCGQRHITSGLYVITAQTDSVSSGGYTSTLDLLRISSDDAYVQEETVTKQVTKTVVVKATDATTKSSKTSGVQDIEAAFNEGSTDYGSSRDLFGSASVTATGTETSTTSGSNGTLTVTDVTDKVAYLIKELMNAGCTFEGACGIAGNFQYESGIEPKRVEQLLVNKIIQKGGPNYGTSNINLYTNQVDSGKITLQEFLIPLLNYGNPPSKLYSNGQHYGYGLAQWTTDSRKTGLYNLSKSSSRSIGDLGLQVDYLLSELNSDPWNTRVFQKLKTTTNLTYATRVFFIGYEWNSSSIDSSSGDGTLNARVSAATKIYNKYKGLLK